MAALTMIWQMPITSPYYSAMKAPFGFPLSPDKWSVIVTDSAYREQLNPTSGTWYNINATTIPIPIGLWKVSVGGAIGISKTTTAELEVHATLSAANNSESDADFTVYCKVYTVLKMYNMIYKEKILSLAAKANYYWNTRNNSGAGIEAIVNRNDGSKLILKAVCAYL